MTPTLNPLNQYPQIRKALYAVQWIANGVLVVAGVVFVTNGTSIDNLPQWYVMALAIGPVLWGYLGLTAQTNVSTGPVVMQGTVVSETGEVSRVEAEVGRTDEPKVSRTETSYQDSPPADPAVGDLWVDTSLGNRLHEWDGTEWVDKSGRGTV